MINVEMLMNTLPRHDRRQQTGRVVDVTQLRETPRSARALVPKPCGDVKSEIGTRWRRKRSSRGQRVHRSRLSWCR